MLASKLRYKSGNIAMIVNRNQRKTYNNICDLVRKGLDTSCTKPQKY